MTIHNITHRKGIAMIELIFAIVVIGITLLSAPLLISQSSKSNITAFQQESIAIAAAHANTLLSYPWDEGNTEGKTSQRNILTVTAGDTDLNANGSLRGSTTVKTKVHQRLRKFADINTNASAIGKDNNDADDMDDFANNALGLKDYSTSTMSINQSYQGEYINVEIKIDTDIAYINNGNIAYTTNKFSFNQPFASSKDNNLSTNIKRITVTLTGNSKSAELNATSITLRSFMCNIGAATPLKTTGN